MANMAAYSSQKDFQVHAVTCKVGKLWIPYIIFRNTDSDEAVTVDGDIRTLVSVTRQGDFVRSGPEVADEGTFCKVISNKILTLLS